MQRIIELTRFCKIDSTLRKCREESSRTPLWGKRGKSPICVLLIWYCKNRLTHRINISILTGNKWQLNVTIKLIFEMEIITIIQANSWISSSEKKHTWKMFWVLIWKQEIITFSSFEQLEKSTSCDHFTSIEQQCSVDIKHRLDTRQIHLSNHYNYIAAGIHNYLIKFMHNFCLNPHLLGLHLSNRRVGWMFQGHEGLPTRTSFWEYQRQRQRQRQSPNHLQKQKYAKRALILQKRSAQNALL